MRRRHLFPGFSLTLVFAFAGGLVLAGSASAAWVPGGQLMSNPGDVNGVRNARIMELPSGDLVVLGVGSGGSSNTYALQRVRRDGVIAPGWPANGIRYSSVIKGAPLRAHSFVVDDASRTWHSWAWSTSFVQSVSASGAVAPLPAGTAYSVGSGATVAHAAPAPGGEVFVTSTGARLKRLTADGTAATGWPSTGVALPGTSYDDDATLPDGSGGVVVFMRSQAGSSAPVATRIDGNGIRHAGWDALGLLLSNAASSSDLGGDSQLLPSGPDHALAVWSNDAGSGTRRLMMQRFGLDATVDPAWPDDGLEVVAPDTLAACRAIADGSGGAYIVRQSHGRPVVTHVTAAATLIGGANVEYVDAAAQYVPSLVGGVATQGIPDDMIADVTPDGGLLVGWNDLRLAPAVTFRLRWLTPSLTPAAGKPDTGLAYFPQSAHPTVGALYAVHADGTDGAFIAWGDYHLEGGSQISGDLWMTRVEAPATVGVGVSMPRALKLSAPRPNPAIESVALDLVLPDDSPARVELLDLAGRVLRTRSVEGAGPHAITFDALSSLAPGLYFVRASSRGVSNTVRVVVSR